MRPSAIVNPATLAFAAWFVMLGFVYEPTGLGSEGVGDPNASLQSGISALSTASLLLAATKLQGLGWVLRLIELSGYGFAPRQPRRAFTPTEARLFLWLIATCLLIAGAVWFVSGVIRFRDIGCDALQPNNWCSLYDVF